MASTKPIRKTQQERREETRKKVLLSAIELFGSKGYEDTSLEDIAKHAGITTGPIYHYFENKLGLFRSVNHEMEKDIVTLMDKYLEDGINAYILETGWDEFLALCQSNRFVQITLTDAPHVLGKDFTEQSTVIPKANALISSYADSILEIPASVTNHKPNDMDKELVTRMIIAALSEAALMIGQNPDYDSRPLISSLLSLLNLSD